MWVPQEQLDLLEQMERLDLREQLDLLEQMERLDLREQQDLRELPVQKEQQDLREQLAHSVAHSLPT